MPPIKIFVIGYPGEIGGACTELWHALRLWSGCGVEVTLIPTWEADSVWRQKVDALGYKTVHALPNNLDQVDGLAESIVVSLCNGQFLQIADRLRGLGCRLVWLNCMTWPFEQELKLLKSTGPFDAYVFQSQFQRRLLEEKLTPLGYRSELGHHIRGSFIPSDWEFNPRSHGAAEPFVVGRMARADGDKWSSNTWKIYGIIPYQHRRAIVMGVNEQNQRKLGMPPAWADVLKPGAMPVRDYLRQLHCLLPINGGARENWPQAGLEAMAAGVPIVAQNDWGWKEMIVHGETGFLASCDEELAYYAGRLAYDEELRTRIIHAARERLQTELANPDVLGQQWLDLFQLLSKESREASGETREILATRSAAI